MSNQDGHPMALQEALTAVYADEQKRSGDYHNLLYSDQPNLTEESFSSFVVELGLDLAAFSKCIEAKLPFKNTENDNQDVRNFGFSTTPTFLMGRRLTFPTIAKPSHQEFGLAWEVRNAGVWVNLTKN